MSESPGSACRGTLGIHIDWCITFSLATPSDRTSIIAALVLATPERQSAH